MKPATVALIAGGVALVLIASSRRAAPASSPGLLGRLGTTLTGFADDVDWWWKHGAGVVAQIPSSDTLGPWESYWNERTWERQSDGRTYVGAPY